MGVAGQTPAAGAGRFMGELKAQGEEKGEDTFDKCLAIIQQAKVGRFIVEINSDSAVAPRWCGCCAQSVTPRSCLVRC
jgi:hypothetical protein